MDSGLITATDFIQEHSTASCLELKGVPYTWFLLFS
jgi:hypothetical protein